MSLIHSFLGEDENKKEGDLGWVAAGITLFAFAAPSAVQSAPFFIGATGLLGGALICVFVTLGSIAGSWMLLQVKLQYPTAHSFGDLGLNVLGRPGQIVGNLIQLGNFVLFLPCALLFTGQALEGIGYGIKSFTQSNGAPCWDYYIFVIALVCFLTTQARTLSNTAIFSAISFFSVIVMGVTQLAAISSYDAVDKLPAAWFGNPAAENSFLLFTRGSSIAVFGYVPSFLTAELASCMKEPAAMTKSLALSGFLNILMMLGVGIPVVACWGYNMGYVAPLTGQFAGPGTANVPEAWAAGNVATTVLQTFALTGNFVSYMLDSVPLGRYCQKTWAPRFSDTWSFLDCFRYMGYTLPAFALGLLMAVFFPSLDFLINVVTFATTPWVTMVYPAVLYWKCFNHASSREPMLDGSQRPGISNKGKCFVAIVFLAGLFCFFLSAFAGIGSLVVDGTTAWQIGCEGWMIMAPKA